MLTNGISIISESGDTGGGYGGLLLEARTGVPGVDDTVTETLFVVEEDKEGVGVGRAKVEVPDTRGDDARGDTGGVGTTISTLTERDGRRTN